MTNSATIIDFVILLTARDKWHSLPGVLRHAKGHELWEWQEEALVFELSEETSSGRTMAKALVAMIGREATRRLGPKSVDNPDGWERRNVEPEKRTGDAQRALALGGVVD